MKVYDDKSRPYYLEVRNCFEVLHRLGLLKYEQDYELIYETPWDFCMWQALVDKKMDALDLTRLIVVRFLRFTR